MAGAWGGRGLVGGALPLEYVSRPVMPLFKKKDPKEQVSRPLDDLEVETAVCDRTCLITSLAPAQRMEITVEKGAESDSETNQW